MPLRRLLALALLTCFACVSCGESAKTFDVSVKQQSHQGTMRPQVLNVTRAANGAVKSRRALVAFIAARNQAKNNPRLIPAGASPVVVVPTTTTVLAATSIDWNCVAVAETGADWTMHGSTYSTAYGVVNDIVYEYASPEVQAKVFAGTASQAEQTDIVARFAADHGTDGWGELTKQKCGL